jgi:hypothetical protein
VVYSRLRQDQYPAGMALEVLGLTSNIAPLDIAETPQASPKSMLQAVQDGKVGVLLIELQGLAF